MEDSANWRQLQPEAKLTLSGSGRSPNWSLTDAMLLTCSSVRGALASQSSSEMTVGLVTCGVEAREPEAVRGSGGRRRLKPPGVEGRDMPRFLREEAVLRCEEGR